MSLLAAAFLAGLAVVAVPLWLHRLNERSPAESTVSSLMLMRAAEDPVRTRRALAHRVLLALRLALLTALALAFAQPVLDTAASLVRSERASPANLVVLDASLSMRREAVWSGALAEARELLTDESRILLAGARLTAVSSLADAEAGWSRLEFGGLAARLDAALAAWPEPPGGWLIHLISDFQASAVPERFNALVEGATWPVALHDVGVDEANWSVEARAAERSRRVEATLVGMAGESRRLAVTLRRDGDDFERAEVVVPSGGRVPVAFDIPPPTRDAGVWELAIDVGDTMPDDDIARVVQSAADGKSVAVLAVNADPTARRFLVAALDASGLPEPAVLDAGAAWPSAPDALIVLDPGALPGPEQRRLERHVADGGGVLVVAGPRTARHGALPFGAALTASVFDQQRRVVVADRGHPLTEGGWEDVAVTRSLALSASPAETILALAPTASEGRVEGGVAPLLVETRVGKGRVLVLLTALHRDWSSLVLRPAFVGLIGNAVNYLAGDFADRAYAGEALAVAATSVQLFDADGARVLALNETAAGSGAGAVRVWRPGVYTVRTPGRETLLAVNVDPRESDLRPAADDVLQRWQAAARRQAVATPTGAADNAPPTPKPLAPWLLALAAAMLLAESVAANVGRIGLGVGRPPFWPKVAG